MEGSGPPPQTNVTEGPLAGSPITPEIAEWIEVFEALVPSGLVPDPGDPSLPKGWPETAKQWAAELGAATGMNGLPMSVAWAWTLLARRRHPDDFVETSPAMLQALKLEMRAWSTLIRALIDRYGAETVRADLAANLHAVALGFNGFALWLYDSGKLSLPPGLPEEMNRFREFGPSALERIEPSSADTSPAGAGSPGQVGQVASSRKQKPDQKPSRGRKRT